MATPSFLHYAASSSPHPQLTHTRRFARVYHRSRQSNPVPSHASIQSVQSCLALDFPPSDVVRSEVCLHSTPTLPSPSTRFACNCQRPNGLGCCRPPLSCAPCNQLKQCSRSMSHWSRLSIVAARPKPAPMSHSRIVVAFARK